MKSATELHKKGWYWLLEHANYVKSKMYPAIVYNYLFIYSSANVPTHLVY